MKEVVITGFSVQAKGNNHEAHLSAIKDPPQPNARISRAHENSRRSCRHPGSSGQGSRASGRLSVSPAFFFRILRERSDFESVLKFDCRVGGRYFLVRAKPNARSYARLGIIAGKKVAARAVDRNRGKRLIREWFRDAAEAIGPLDVVVQLRSDLRQQTNDAARRELHGLVAGLVKCRSR